MIVLLLRLYWEFFLVGMWAMSPRESPAASSRPWAL